MTSVVFTPGFATRLALAVDPRALLVEVESLDPAAWSPSFDRDVVKGAYDSVTLLSQSARADSVHSESASSSYQAGSPTEWLARCPALTSFLASLPFTVEAARLLRLVPDGTIREQRDYDLRDCEGHVRLHIPLLTNDRVLFYIEQTLVESTAGECWRLDLSRRHRVQNLGTTPRVDLVLDCALNSWLESALGAGFVPQCGTAPPTWLSGAAQFELFRERVFSDLSLQQALRTTKEMDVFLAKTLAAGAEHGFAFSLDDVRAHCNQARRDWIEQWIV